MGEVVEEVNHFVPQSSWVFIPTDDEESVFDFLSNGFATVSLWLTSEPPIFSVIHCPEVQKVSGFLEVKFLKAVFLSWSDP